MSRPRYVSDVKLCLEILSRFEIYPDLEQLEHFLADEKHLELLNQCLMLVKTAWQENMDTNLTTANPLDDRRLCAKNPVEAELIPPPPANISLEKHPEAGIPVFNPQEILPENPPESETLNPIQPPQKSPVRFKLPNATVGKSYQAQLEWTSTTKITVLHINGLNDLGLCYDLESNTLSGEPKTAGEYQLIISYQQDDDIAQATQTVELSLVINSDPKSLWKNISSDKTVRFWKADSDYQGKTGLYGWKLAVASKRGRSHAHIGSCRDDDFALQVDNESLWQIVAVADGAGSSEFSREGARIVAHNSVEILSTQLQQANPALDALINRWQLDKSSDNETVLQQTLADIFSAALTNAVETIEALAKQQQVAYRDFYSTLLIAAHKSLPTGEFVVAYWIGDGGLAIYNAEQSLELLGINDSGEYAGQTRFLDKNALERNDLVQRLRFNSQKTFTALVLMTDGITDPLFETDNNLRDVNYWDKLWQQIQPKLDENPELSAQNLTDWLDFWSPGNHDDRTIALIYR